MEVLNILETKLYGLSGEENIPMIKKLGWEALKLIQTFTQEGKEKCRNTKGFLKVLCSEFQLQHNRIVTLLQYHKLNKKESMQEWMGGLRTKAAEHQFKEYARCWLRNSSMGMMTMEWSMKS